MTKLSTLIDAWAEDYSVEEFLTEFLPNLTFGELVENAFDNGLIPNDQIEKFLED